VTSRCLDGKADRKIAKVHHITSELLVGFAVGWPFHKEVNVVFPRNNEAVAPVEIKGRIPLQALEADRKILRFGIDQYRA